MLHTVQPGYTKELAGISAYISLNKQQFFGIVTNGHYLFIFKELSTRMVQRNAWVVLLFNGKVEDVVLVTNRYGESWDLSCEKYSVPVQKH